MTTGCPKAPPGGRAFVSWTVLLLALVGNPGSVRADEPAQVDGELCCPGSVDWTKVPPVRPLPRLGMAVLFPSDPGFYSLSNQVHHHYDEKAPAWPWGFFSFTPGTAFDLDFRYLDRPGNTQHDFFDPLKRIHLGDDWLFSVGGQTWLRTMNEVDSRLTTTDNDYQLIRTRLYGDLWYRDQFRLFVEGLYAESFNFDLAPLPIDINRGELLNLFVDAKLGEPADGTAYLRVGRQELLYGSQRLISPLEWANTRRTFQGIKALYTGKDWDVDLFWVQPVLVDRADWDSVDNNQNLFGAGRRARSGPGPAGTSTTCIATTPIRPRLAVMACLAAAMSIRWAGGLSASVTTGSTTSS